MICTYIRSSSWANFSFCEMQYFITYVLGYQPDTGKKAILGTIVHKVLEVLAVLKKYHQDNPDSDNMVINDDSIGELSIPSNRLFDESLIEELLDLSYTHYTTDSGHEWAKADKRTCLKNTQTALLFNNGQFDPRLRKIVAPEPHFDIPIEEDWAHYNIVLPDGTKAMGQLAIKGTIDLVTEVAPNIIEVIDWKTGMRKDWATGDIKDYEKLCNDPQLLLYNYAITKLYPQYEQSIMSIFFIKDGGPFSMCFDEDDNKRFLKMLRQKYEAITKNNKPKPISYDRSNWKCSKLCHYAKNNWPGTNVSMCQHTENTLKKEGMQETLVQLTRDGHSIGYYSAPGA